MRRSRSTCCAGRSLSTASAIKPVRLRSWVAPHCLELYWKQPRSSMKKYGKFAALAAVIVLGIGYLAFQGMASNQTYYKTIPEVAKMGQEAYNKRLRVGGDVEPGSIQRVGSSVHFVIVQDNPRLKVSYVGTEPLPDTFKDGAQALADGKL